MPPRRLPELPLLAMLAGKEEDRFTEYLAALLRDSRLGFAFLQEFCKLQPHGGELSVETQFVVDKGRPDLVLTGDDFVVVVEVKVRSVLRKGQLKPYAKHLAAQNRKRKRLAVLVPGAAVEGTEAVAYADVGENQIVFAWEEVARFLSARAKSLDPADATRTWMLGFADLLAFHLRQEVRAMTADEIKNLASPGVASGLRNAVAMIDPIKQHLVDEGFTATKSTTFFYEGHTVWDQTGRWWWFGFWLSAWEETGRGPLLLQLPGTSSSKPAPELSSSPKPVKCERVPEKCWAIPLDVREGEAPSAAAQRLGSLIARWIRERPETAG